MAMMGGAGHDGGGPFPGMRDAEVQGRLAPGQQPRGSGSGTDRSAVAALVLGLVGIAAAFVAAGLALALGVIGGALALRARSRAAAGRDGNIRLALAAIAGNAVAVVLGIVLLIR